jgi:hypothetical protein
MLVTMIDSSYEYYIVWGMSGLYNIWTEAVGSNMKMEKIT